MVETLAAVAILAVIGVGVLGGLTLSTKIMGKTDIDEKAKDLAVAQMELIKGQDYSADGYTKDTGLFPDDSPYDAEITILSLKTDDSLQQITVKVSNNGKLVSELSGYKANND
jgi:hypothetical protein